MLRDLNYDDIKLPTLEEILQEQSIPLAPQPKPEPPSAPDPARAIPPPTDASRNGSHFTWDRKAREVVRAEGGVTGQHPSRVQLPVTQFIAHRHPGDRQRCVRGSAGLRQLCLIALYAAHRRLADASTGIVGGPIVDDVNPEWFSTFTEPRGPALFGVAPDMSWTVYTCDYMPPQMTMHA